MDHPSLYKALTHLVGVGPDLTARQVAVLLAIYDQPQTIRGMAENLRLAKPAVSRASDRLVLEKLADKVPEPDDRRSVLLKIRPAGRKLVDAAIAAAKQKAKP